MVGSLAVRSVPPANRKHICVCRLLSQYTILLQALASQQEVMFVFSLEEKANCAPDTREAKVDNIQLLSPKLVSHRHKMDILSQKVSLWKR